MVKSRFFILLLLMLSFLLIFSCQVGDKATSVLRSNRSVKVAEYTKIAQESGNFSGDILEFCGFGTSVNSIGDLDGDGVLDIAVGVAYDNDGGANRGAVWILFLNSDGSVKSYHKISDAAGIFGGELENGDCLGVSVAGIGDLNNDGVADIVAGARRDSDGGTYRGAVWILFLNSDGSVKSHHKISDAAGLFGGELENEDYFGSSVCSLGDLNNDGVIDIAVGAPYSDDGSTAFSDRGAVWILFLNSDGSVKTLSKISDTDGGFDGTFSNNEHFGTSLCSLGDINNDGFQDIAVGTDLDAVWVLSLNNGGSVEVFYKISSSDSIFDGKINSGECFGCSVSSLGDLNNDSITDIAVGACWDDDGNDGGDRGAVWILFLNNDFTVKSYQKISDLEGSFNAALDDTDYFGCSVCSLGDLNNDGVMDMAVGAYGDDGEGDYVGMDRGAVYNLFLHRVY